MYLSPKNKISEKGFYEAIADLSRIKNTNLDQLIDETDPVGHMSLVFKSLFSSSKMQDETRGIEGLLNILIVQEGLHSKRLKPDEYGRWNWSDEDDASLRTLYRNHTLQKMLDELRADQHIIDVYSEQDTKKKLGPIHIKYPPMVRSKDQIKDLKKSVKKQDKRYERLAAQQHIKDQQREYHEMVKRASRVAMKSNSDDDDNPDW